MRVKCVLCDTVETIDDETSLAKRLRNRPIHTFMCETCNKRITEKTNKHESRSTFKHHHRRKKKLF